MKVNKNNGTLDLVPMTLNIVNLQGLKLICRKTSERYEKKTSKQKEKSRMEQVSEIKNRQFRSNKIYFNKKKEKDDEVYFSDYKIKYGTEHQHQSFDKIVIHTAEQLNNHNLDPKEELISQNIGLFLLNPNERQEMNLEGQTINFGMSNRKIREHIEGQRNAKTKLEKRKTPRFIKMSFSHKNYQRINIQQNKTNTFQADNKLDGWAIHSPLIYDIDKKLDITSYAQPEEEEVKNYFSERKRTKEVIRYHSRSKKVKF